MGRRQKEMQVIIEKYRGSVVQTEADLESEEGPGSSGSEEGGSGPFKEPVHRFHTPELTLDEMIHFDPSNSMEDDGGEIDLQDRQPGTEEYAQYAQYAQDILLQHARSLVADILLVDRIMQMVRANMSLVAPVYRAEWGRLLRSLEELEERWDEEHRWCLTNCVCGQGCE
ncbi:hypothetical protein TWF481_002829 [Arthrobotrys musiformis]|uniref:Uncharacterized protein n=1 Tax=Arthrobotrys musiformis TaxID=47236 RepID=A0AAV9VT28_9PEZI